MLVDPDCIRPTAVVRSWCFTNTIRFGDVRGVAVFASGNSWKAHFRLTSWNQCRKPNRPWLLSDNLYSHLESLIDPAIVTDTNSVNRKLRMTVRVRDFGRKA